MKTVVRIFNFIIMGLSLAASILLFTVKPMTFDSKIAIDIDTFSKFVPETEYSKDIDIVKLLGTKTIEVSIKFDLDSQKTLDFMNGDRNKINDTVINQNINSITDTLREPVDLITDFTIRSVIKSTLKDEVKKKVQEGIDNASVEITSTVDEIMDEVGMDDAYFSNFAIILYNSANEDDATIDSVSDVLFSQINDAVAKAEDNGAVNVEGFTEDAKASIKANMLQVFSDLNLVESDGVNLKKISNICYIYLAKYLRDGLAGKVSEEKLAQQAGENDVDYSDRLLGIYVATMLPNEFYDTIGYVSLGLFIGMFVFGGIWIVLFVITLIKTFTKKPWTIFGPWFWILGSLQLVLGLGLTFIGKVIVPSIAVQIPNIPLKSIILAPRTYALVPSILFLVCIVVAFVYGFFARRLKKQFKKEKPKKA